MTSLSPAESVCLSASGPALLRWGRQRPVRSASLGVATGHGLCKSFWSLWPGADDGGSRGKAGVGLAPPLFPGPLPGLHSWARISLLIICQEDQDLELFPPEAKTNHFFPLL